MTMRLIAGTCALIMFSGCGGGGGGGDSSVASTSVTVSGQLSVANSSSSFQKTLMQSKNGDIANDALAVTDYKASCTTTSVPPLTGTAAVAADGTFDIVIANAKGMPMSCSLIKTADNEKAADFLIEDSSKKDMNGNNEHSTTLTPNGDVDMSTITFDAATGEVTVPKSAVASAVGTTVTGTVFDPTGTWTIGDVDFTLPAGVRGTCTTAEQNANTCSGPPNGQQIYLKLWDGLQSGSTVYGLQVWQGAASFASCGSAIGLSAQQKTDIGVDFSSHGSADTTFTYASSLTFNDQTIAGSLTSATLVDGWKASTAKNQWDFNPNCGPQDVTLGGVSYSNAWKCGPDNGNASTGHYQVSLSGGCTIDSTGKATQITDWSIFSAPGACTMSEDATTHVQENVCQGNATINSVSTAVTCRNKWAVTNQAGTVLTGGSATFDWTTFQAAGVAKGTSCSSLSNGSLEQLRCYADYYYQSGLERNSSACMPRINTDWSASTAADFINVDNKPGNLIFFEQYKPFPDGTGGTITSRQERFDGVNVDGNSWVNCRVIETGVLGIKKVNANKMLMTYQSSRVTSSTGKPACMANFTGKKDSFIFYMTK